MLLYYTALFFERAFAMSASSIAGGIEYAEQNKSA
jgi:hypothetical protein